MWTYSRRFVFVCFYLSQMRLIISNPVEKQECFKINCLLLNTITIFLTYRCVTLIELLALKPAYGFRIISFIAFRVSFNSLTFSYIFQVFIFLSHFYSCLIELSGDVEKNPRTNFKPDQSFSICHQNLKSIAAYNFSKIRISNFHSPV